MPDAPVDNLVRAYARPEAAEYRESDDGEAGVMHGHFAVFNRWTEIDSWYEGRFLERIAPGAFADTFATRGDQIRVLYDHGHDPQIGNKPLGTPDVLAEDKHGARYEVGLFDAGYVNDLKPALRAGQLGASFRFRVTAESWVEPAKESKSNPQKLPERTIEAVDLFEFGPVTFPAYADATAGLRSATDEFLDRLINDPVFAARFADRTSGRVLANTIEPLRGHVRSDDTGTDGHASDDPTHTQSERRLWVAERHFTVAEREMVT